MCEGGPQCDSSRANPYDTIRACRLGAPSRLRGLCRPKPIEQRFSDPLLGGLSFAWTVENQ